MGLLPQSGSGSLCKWLRIMTRQATPALFAVSMGTGGVNSLFLVFPYGQGSRAMITFSQLLFFLNLFLFVFFLLLSLAKYTLYPGTWTSLFRNPVTSLYVGCCPMAATTLINVAVVIFHDRDRVGGRSFLNFLWGMWWLDVVISFLCCWVGIHIMVTYQEHSLESMTAMWLLPVVTLIVASSSGGIISGSVEVYSTQSAFDTLMASIFLVIVGLSLALMILVIYLQRLVIHGVPPGGALTSVFLPLGPTGQAGYSILIIGERLRALLPRNSSANSHFLNSDDAATIIDVICICLSFALWSLATMWTFYGFLSIYARLRESLVNFKLSFWGMVFPSGVYANLTIQLGNAFDSKPLRVWGAICATGTLLLWLSIVLRSIVEIKNLIKMHGVLADSPHLTEELKQDSPPESGWTNSTITHNEQV